MIDFQSGGLEFQVYELIVKMCDMAMSDEFPHFKTRQLDDGMWLCELEIPGIHEIARATQKSEVAAVNRCASNMLHILDCSDEVGRYDPSLEESLYKRRIEEIFGDVEYDPRYHYYLSHREIPISENEQLLKSISDEVIKKATRNEIVKMNVRANVNCLVRCKKKGQC